MLVKAAQVGARAWEDTQGEADRLRRELGLDGEYRGFIFGGDLLGSIHIAGAAEPARRGQWIVRLPDHFDLHAGHEIPTLLVLHDETFRMLFFPAREMEG